MKNIELAMQLVTEPKAAFESLKVTPRFWFPLLVMAFSSAAVLFWYFSIVDFEWLREHMLSGNPKLDKMSDADRARAASFMSKNVLMWGALISAIVFVPVVRFVEGLYYLLIGNMTKVEGTIKQWFSLACWSGLPMLVSILPMVILLIMRGNGQISMESLTVLSLNELLFHFPVGHKWQSFAGAITLLHPWVWWLTVVGVKVFSGRSTMYSTLVVMLPLAIFYGGWALFSGLMG